MTITEFLNKGGEINLEWNFISKSFTSDDITNDDKFKTCDDLVQYACDEKSYQENKVFDPNFERFYVIDPAGHIIGKNLTNKQATRLIHNYKGESLWN